MFKHFIAAFASFLLLTSSASAVDLPLVQWDFEVNKPFCDVMVDIVREGVHIRKQMRMEIVDEELNSGTLIINGDGWSLIIERNLVADMKLGGEVDIVESVEITDNSISIKQVLDGDDDYYKEFKVIMELIGKGDKTQINTSYWVSLHRGNREFIIRAVVRGNARRLEQAIRDAVEGKAPIEENKDENAPANNTDNDNE